VRVSPPVVTPAGEVPVPVVDVPLRGAAPITSVPVVPAKSVDPPGKWPLPDDPASMLVVGVLVVGVLVVGVLVVGVLVVGVLVLGVLVVGVLVVGVLVVEADWYASGVRISAA
jgi:hypothetical protein